jgi:hypothetical protein
MAACSEHGPDELHQHRLLQHRDTPSRRAAAHQARRPAGRSAPGAAAASVRARFAAGAPSPARSPSSCAGRPPPSQPLCQTNLRWMRPGACASCCHGPPQHALRLCCRGPPQHALRLRSHGPPHAVTGRHSALCGCAVAGRRTRAGRRAAQMRRPQHARPRGTGRAPSAQPRAHEQHPRAATLTDDTARLRGTKRQLYHTERFRGALIAQAAPLVRPGSHRLRGQPRQHQLRQRELDVLRAVARAGQVRLQVLRGAEGTVEGK